MAPSANSRRKSARTHRPGKPWPVRCWRGCKTISHPSSYFIWLPLAEDARADQIAMALMREQVSVSPAEPFAITHHVPHAIRLALGSVDMDALRQALVKVKRVVGYYS